MQSADIKTVMKTQEKLMTGVSLKEILEEELDILDTILEHQKNFQKAVIEQNWKELHYLVEVISDCNNTLIVSEQNRAMHVRMLRNHYQIHEKERFFTLLENFSDSMRVEISDLYRRRTLLLLKLKSIHEHVTYYIRESLGHYEQILNSLFSDRFTGTYSIVGLKDRTISGPVMLDWSS